MSSHVDILAIDDDKFSQKIIRRAVETEGASVRFADNGDDGIAEVMRCIPDIILLDVEMPGMNGYEVCDRLRNSEEGKNVPIVFLSSHSSLQERMQGYEVGADDYLVKPFEPDHLNARLSVLLKYKAERNSLQEQYELAKKTAMIAMTGHSELGLAMNFVENSYAYKTYDELSSGLFHVTNELGLDCSFWMLTADGEMWFSSEGSIKPLEKELIEMSERDLRFFDFGIRTIVNFPNVRLLVKNMPLDDMERYGRLKDFFPILLSAVNAKVSSLNIETALSVQSAELLTSFGRIRTNFYYLVKDLLKNQVDSTDVLKGMLNKLNIDLLRMGLEEDQEEYLLNHIDTAVESAIDSLDARESLHQTFSAVLYRLKEIARTQEELVDAFTVSQAAGVDSLESNYEGDIELF